MLICCVTYQEMCGCNTLFKVGGANRGSENLQSSPCSKKQAAPEVLESKKLRCQGGLLMYERKMKTRWKKEKRLLACVLSLVMIFSSSAVGWALDRADVSSITSTIPVTEPAERQMLFDEGWRFHLGDEANAANSNFDDSAWRSLTLPHDWSIELDFTHDVSSEVGHLDGGTGWYRKNFTLPAEMQGKTINIDFGGVYMDSYVYVNGELVGNHPYGYTPFSFDITDGLCHCGPHQRRFLFQRPSDQAERRYHLFLHR